MPRRKFWLLIFGGCLIVTTLGERVLAADDIAYMGTVAGEFGTLDLNTGVYTITVPRDDWTIMIEGMEVPTAAGLESVFHFYYCPCGKTNVVGQFCVLDYESNDVIDALRAARIEIASVAPMLLHTRQAPVLIRFFAEGNDARGDDLKAVAAGIRLARKLAAPLKASGLIKQEELPGADYDDDQLEDFARDRAWGHHASCTCRIGAQEDGGVLSSDFKVHGVTGLRVVDASVFPRIPGFFIVSAVYMIGEKAADVITADAHVTAPLGPVTPFAH